VAERDSIFKDFPRGNPQGQAGMAPGENFQDEQKVLTSLALRFSQDNREGKIFLGLAGASVVLDPNMPYLPDGRTNRYALGGALIGVGDDRHIITIAGSRAGKGRSALVPNLLTYPGSILVLDPKGDLARITAERRRQMGHAQAAFEVIARRSKVLGLYFEAFGSFEFPSMAPAAYQNPFAGRAPSIKNQRRDGKQLRYRAKGCVVTPFFFFHRRSNPAARLASSRYCQAWCCTAGLRTA